MRLLPLCLAVGLLLAHRPLAAEEEPLFSGPQAGEKLAPFVVQGVYDEAEGKELDFVTQAGGKPLMLVFVHEATRPSIALTRALLDYAESRRQDGLHSAVVLLSDDMTEATAFLKRARHAMPQKTPIGVSVDGREGPGAYGLNRNVTLTVLIGKEGRVTANFALVQPSVQADTVRILEEAVKLVGGRVPPLERLAGPQYAPAAEGADQPDPRLRELLGPVIRATATAEEVDKAAADLAAYVKDRPKSREQVGAIARRIIDAGRLDNYGTPQAREHLRRWAREY